MNNYNQHTHCIQCCFLIMYTQSKWGSNVSILLWVMFSRGIQVEVRDSTLAVLNLLQSVHWNSWPKTENHVEWSWRCRPRKLLETNEKNEGKKHPTLIPKDRQKTGSYFVLSKGEGVFLMSKSWEMFEWIQTLNPHTQTHWWRMERALSGNLSCILTSETVTRG